MQKNPDTPVRPAASKRRPGRPRKRRTSARRSAVASRRRVWWIAAVVVGVLIIGFLVRFMLSRSDKETLLLVPENCTSQQLQDSLTKHLGSGYASDVVFLLKVGCVDFGTKQGAYLVPKGTAALTTAWRLARHHQSQTRLVVNHVRTPEQLYRLIAGSTVSTPEEVKKVLSDPEFLREHGVTAEQVRVLFMEDTYNLRYGWDAKQVVAKVAKQYHKFWTDERRAKAKALGLTPEEVMIVASIADEETHHKDERGKIGRLYINRINKKMKLQADPTVKYAVGDFTLRRITGKHTSVDNPYNTYKYAGLPPGPIRTTSAATVDSILNSAPSEYLYMCAKEDFSDRHNFAVTYEEHLKNAKRYQEELDRRNIH